MAQSGGEADERHLGGLDTSGRGAPTYCYGKSAFDI
jgi:hypothetical protein